MGDAHCVRRLAAAKGLEQGADVARDDVAPILSAGSLVPGEKTTQRRSGRNAAGPEWRGAMPGPNAHCAVCVSKRRASAAGGGISSILRNIWPPLPPKPL